MAVDYDRYILSTGTHYISNSGSDENGGTRGGRAGDQSGKEWQLKKWYNRPWTVVLRYPNQSVALTIARLGIAAALNDRIGYDQSQRTSYWTQLKASGYDPSAISATCEEDCTAGVSANVRAAGFIHGIEALQGVPICSSRNMRAQFVKAGFQALVESKYLTGGGFLLPGDILLYENHHAATNVTLGAKVRGSWEPERLPDAPEDADGETDDELDGEEAYDGVEAVVTGSSVNVRRLPDTDDAPLGIVRKGDRLPCYGETFDEAWLFVIYEGQGAWISANYAEVD